MKEIKQYIIEESKKFYEGRDYTPKHPFVVLRYNAKKDTLNPIIQVKSLKEGKIIISLKKGIFILNPYKLKRNLTFKDLFNYVEIKCNFHKEIKGKADSMSWKCNHNLSFVKQFCNKNKLNFTKIKSLLERYGGYCDCEVLFNAEEVIKHSKLLPK